MMFNTVHRLSLRIFQQWQAEGISYHNIIMDVFWDNSSNTTTIRNLITARQLFNLTFDLHCKAIAALFFNPYRYPIVHDQIAHNIFTISVVFFNIKMQYSSHAQ